MKTKNLSQFFVIVPLGFEQEFIYEMQELWHYMIDLDAKPTTVSLPEMTFEKGGVEFKTELHLGLQINLFSKIASRVLLRLAHFYAREPYEFEREFKRIQFPGNIQQGKINLKVSCSSSQLNNEKKVAAIIAQHLKLDDQSETHLYIRIFENYCDVSLDTSGEHLHRRGRMLKRGDAPLRENIAAFAIRQLIHGLSFSQLQNITLFDPMMGSGTILSEAIDLNMISERRFAFQDWNFTPALLKSELLHKNYKLKQGCPFHSLIGNDIDPVHYQIARDNLGLAPQLLLLNKDFFDLHPTDFNFSQSQKRWVVCNPPYGIRIQGIQMDQFLAQLSHLNVERLVLIYPRIQKEHLRHSHFKVISEMPIENGGLKINLTLMEKI